MDSTQMINDLNLESDEAESEEEENENQRGQPLAKLCVLKNEHIPETEFPLFVGDNVLGRDPNTCSLPLPASSISKKHAIISISVYRRRGAHGDMDTEALVWDLGSMNGTRKGRLKLSPEVRYALSDSDSLVLADIPCQYVTVDTVSMQEDTQTPVSRNLGVKAALPGASGENGGDKSTNSKKCVNGGTNTTASSTKTPVRMDCLSFEQTPTHPQGTLVPESDSDSDEESGRVKALVSESDSHKSSPTFLSPPNKIVPESEDESPITPSSSKNRLYRHVSFSKEETEVDVFGQPLEEKKAFAIVDDSEEEEGREEERATLEGTKSHTSGQHVPMTEERNISLSGEDELPVCTTTPTREMISAFNVDSDTDVEGEEEGVVSSPPVTSNTNPLSRQLPNTAEYRMDSDTDVDEDEVALDKSKMVASSDDNTKPTHVNSVIHPEGFTGDSDTDVDDDAPVSGADTKAKPVSSLSAPTADAAPSTQVKDFHLDSDTDVDEEEESGCETHKPHSKVDEAPTRLDMKTNGAESASAIHSLQLDSDTDDEEMPTPNLGEVSAVDMESCTVTDVGPDILSDSDTDVEDSSPQVTPAAVTASPDSAGATSEALRSDDTDTDVDESSKPPAEDGANPPDHRGDSDSDTDVEDKEADVGEAGKDHIPSLCRESTPRWLVPLLQKSSTPILTEEELENMDTQAFLCPSVPFRREVAPAIGAEGLSSCSGSQEDEDFVVAETQSFVLQNQDCQNNPPEDPTQTFGLEMSGDENGEESTQEGSFQLGLSDSSHLQCQAQALAMESTQAFVSVEKIVNLEDTQAYAAALAADITPADIGPNPEATQAHKEAEEPARCSGMSEKAGQKDLALEETQAYISKSCSDSDDETDEDERKNTIAMAETQPLDVLTSCALAMAETQLISAFEEEESLVTDKVFTSAQQVKPMTQNDTEESEQQGETAQPQQRPTGDVLSMAETQPMSICDDEDLFPCPQKRRAKPLQLEEAQTQPFISSDFSVAETQPIATSENEDSDDDDEDSMPGPRKRRAEALLLEAETQPFLAAGTQPISASEGEQSDVDNSVPGPRKRKAKQLHLEEEETETPSNSELSAFETQPVDPVEETESQEEDSIPILRERRAKALQIEVTQSLSDSEVSAAATNRACEGEQSDEDNSVPCPRKRKAKQLHLEEEETETPSNSELSAFDTQPVDPVEETESQDEDSIPILRPRKRKAKALQLEEEETQRLSVDTQPVVRGEDVSDDEDTGPCETKAKALQPKEEKPLAVSEVSAVERRVQPMRQRDTQSEAETSGVSARNKRATRVRLREKEEQAESSELPKRRTRGKTRGRMGRSRPDGDDSEEDKEVEQAMTVTEKKSMRQQRNNTEEEKCETETLEEAEKSSLIEEEQGGEWGEERGHLEREKGKIGKEEQKREIDRRNSKEEQKNVEREQKNMEAERIQAENAERIRLEQERAEKERKEQEEKERVVQIRREKEAQLEKERKEKEEKERLEHEKAEREKKEKLEREKERKEREERERLETEKRELEERLARERKEEEQIRLQREAKGERERLAKENKTKEKETNEREENKDELNKANVPARGRRAARRSNVDQSTIEQDSILASDDVPARRTRSRSNSSNSISSERSASSVSTQPSQGRGRGRGAKRMSEIPQTVTVRSSNRRRTTVAAAATDQDVFPLSRSNSTASLNSDISGCSVSSLTRGRGSQRRGRSRTSEAAASVKRQSDDDSLPQPTARGRNSRKTEGSANVFKEDDEEKVDAQQTHSTRGQRRATRNPSVCNAAHEDNKSNQDEGHASEESHHSKRNVRGRAQQSVRSEAVVTPAAASDGDETEDKRKGRKRELEANTGKDSCSSSKVSKAQTPEATEEEVKDEIPVQAKRRGRASCAQTKNTKETPHEVEVKEEKIEEIVAKKGRCRTSAIQKNRKKQQEESENSSSSLEQDTEGQSTEPQTLTSGASRKRQAPASSPLVAKTPRSCASSPAPGGRSKAVSQAYKVLFTGVVDESGERVLARLGGSMAKGVADMNYLVTDKVRRTVKFLCAMAKGIPIVTTHWLEKSGKAGSFLPTDAFLVKDAEQETKFSFCLHESLRTARSQPLLQGYEIHVTKSVKPEPVYMKDIISCSGATFLPKMPSSLKPQTVVVSCEEDWALCGPAVAASLPVVTAEFILTGILQQRVDFQSHALSVAPVQPAGGRGRGRKKT
ncbi:mediator of DNA damage checkpoint protein 1 [Solea solea]|uniref:mediator of DNA damage checkpoint protein 1 n=1 Tax=Solea solea TaxID=90069 RepID=UPI00272C8678|nr:mediator of DNA damage checkpoint protein 1 [Solea solea]